MELNLFANLGFDPAGAKDIQKSAQHDGTSLLESEKTFHYGGVGAPLFFDSLETFSASAREFVITGAAIILRGPPFGFDKAL
jgi:hypothetical protein